MFRRFVCVLMTATLCSATALADGGETIVSQSNAGEVSLTPASGLVPLHISVTQPRRVFVRASNAAPGLRYVCTTPCRLFVHPGAVDVTLIGWGTHEYHWDVPRHGGAVNLAARLPTGELAPLPSEDGLAPATEDARIATNASPALAPSVATETDDMHQNLALHAGIVIGSVGGAGLALAHSLAMLETITASDDSAL